MPPGSGSGYLQWAEQIATLQTDERRPDQIDLRQKQREHSWSALAVRREHWRVLRGLRRM